MDHSQEHRNRPLANGFGRFSRATAAAILFVAVLVPSIFSGAGASDACGTYSFGFEGTRLLNDGISNVSGPYPIDLPAGTYTVTLVAHDHHDQQVGVPTQPGEQYTVELDSGYTSPASTDIPDELILTTTVFPNQKIAASSTITVRHGGAPGINSVDVVCVGFTPVEVPPPAVDPTDERPSEPPSSEDTANPDDPEVPGVVFPNPLDPPTDPPVERPTQDIGDPVGIVRDPDPGSETPVPANPLPIEPDVLGVIESPPVAPQLAITGPAEHASQLLGAGVVLVLLGAFLVHRQRRWNT